MHDRTARLREIMGAHALSVRDVATLLDRSEMTVRIWRSENPGRVIPDVSLRLLEAEVRLKGAAA